ncbi:MAG: type II secretion system F family protein [Anaerolineae bacterium]|nr:type II secretion system F family protein [Anaerolineae bacterium]
MAFRKLPSLEDRLAEFGTLDRPVSLEEIELSLPFTERVIRPMINSLAEFAMRFSPARSREALQHKLDLAGNPYTLTKFMGTQILTAILFGALGIALFFLLARAPSPMLKLLRPLMPFVGAGLGYYFPVLSLSSKIRRRQRNIIRALPDALDLLTICVEAGLGFDAAMAKVAEKWNNELSQAFARVISEIQLGKLRREALRDMADRMEVQDVSTFVAAIIQADQLGVSIAKVLRIQSDQMRLRRRQRAEEQANQAGIKMLPAIAFLIFPAIFIILLGPAVVQIIVMFTSGQLRIFG